jgi:hypothetical protein
MDYQQAASELVIARLKAMPPNVKFSLGKHGTFTCNQLISEVKGQTATGKSIVEMQLNFVREMPALSQELI